MLAFFRRVKAGYPRFKSHSRFDSFTYPQSGFSLTQDHRVCLSKIGTIKMKLHRPIEGKMKTCTIKREVDQWYLVLSCEVRRKKAVIDELQRKDFLHKASRKLANTYGTIYLENLNIAGMTRRPKPTQDEATKAYVPNGASAKAGLNTSILDAGWYQFQRYCTYKAEEAGRSVVFVDPKYTSQRCSNCDRIVKKTLSDRWHSCGCGTTLDRDHNSALEIKRLRSSQQCSDTL
jgi:IS605 OrfB family transposase